MSENLNPFDNHFRQRLTDVESAVPDDLFDRLQARRGAASPSDAPLRERMSAHETPVSDGIFDAILSERERQKRRRIVMWRSVTAVAAALLLLFVAIEFKNKNTILIDKSVELNGVKNIDNNAAVTDFNNNETVKNNENTEGGDSELKIKNLKLNAQDSELKIKNLKLNVDDSELKIQNSELSKTNDLVSNNVEKQQIIINKKTGFNTNKNVDSNQKVNKTQSNNTISSIFSDKLGDKNTDLNSAKNLRNSKNTEGGNWGLKNKKFKLKDVNTGVNNSSNNVEFVDNTVINPEFKTNNATLNNNKITENGLNTEGSILELKIKNDALNTLNSQLKTASENRLLSPNFQTQTVDFLNILSVKTVTLPTENRKNPCSDPGNGCPNFNGKRGTNGKNYYVDAFVAPEYMMRSFKTNLPESEKLLAARDSNEKVQYAVSTGVRGSVVFGNGISLRTGLVYNQMNERVQFDSLGIGTIQTTYNVRIVNGKPDTVSVTTVITDGIFRKTRYNRYRSIDIPLQIGYQKQFKNGWIFGVNMGANFNITAWRKADIFGKNLEKQTVSSSINEVNPVFRNQLGVSLIGSVAAYRQLTRGFELMIEPSVRYGLQPITRSDYALKQQYSTAGLIVGLRLRL